MQSGYIPPEDELIFTLRRLTYEPSETPPHAHPDAAEAAELGAMWAEPGIPQLFHADKAPEHLRNTLEGGAEVRDRGYERRKKNCFKVTWGISGNKQQ